jgi:hypothetical protein
MVNLLSKIKTDNIIAITPIRIPLKVETSAISMVDKPLLLLSFAVK